MQNPFEITLENQADDEEIMKIWRHHPVTYIKPALKTLALAVVPLALLLFTGFALFNSIWLFVIFLVIVAIVLTYGADQWISWYGDVFVLTNYRIVDVQQHGFFSRKFAEASLSKIQDINYDVSGVFQTFFSYGTVEVQTAGAETKLRMQDIAQPQQQAVYLMKRQQELVGKDEAMSAEDLIRLLAKHKDDLDQIAKTEKESKVKEVADKLKEDKGKSDDGV